MKMRKYFNESLENRLLLINYPMIESYKHLQKMPDQDFISKSVTKEQVKKYKELVGFESKYTDISKYHREIVLNLIIHHLIKLNFIITGNKIMPDHLEIELLVLSNKLVQLQFENYNLDKLYVISTIYYYIIELKPISFYDELQLPIVNKLLE